MDSALDPAPGVAAIATAQEGGRSMFINRFILPQQHPQRQSNSTTKNRGRHIRNWRTCRHTTILGSRCVRRVLMIGQSTEAKLESSIALDLTWGRRVCRGRAMIKVM